MENYDIADELRSHLRLNEELIWTGRPKTGIVFHNSDIFLIPFSLLWCGFVIFIGTKAKLGLSLFSIIISIPFVVMGLYISFGRFFFDAMKRANTMYGITQDRVIIKSGIFNISIKSIDIKTISDITFSEKADNSGTIILGPTNILDMMTMQGMEKMGAKQTPKLEFIDDVKMVYSKIIEIQRQK